MRLVQKAKLRATRRVLGISALLLAAGCASTRATSGPSQRMLLSGTGQVGRLPEGFSTALTGGGGPIKWVLRDTPAAPGGGPSLVQESADETSYRFPVCVYDRLSAADASAEVKWRPISGTVDQAGGIVLRYRPENYYVARANALEDNVNLFKTVNGNRMKIAEVETKVTPGQWHTLGFAAQGSHLVVTFDGKTVIEADDTTFKKAGRVGLWTKADSVSAFADLRIEADALTLPMIRPIFSVLILCVALAAGCQESARSGAAAASGGEAIAGTLDAAVRRAQTERLPLVVLVVDPSRGPADTGVLAAFQSVVGHAGDVGSSSVPVVLDLRTSRNRAAAAPLHALDGPTLVCRSAGGVGISRDERPITAGLVRRRIEEAIRKGPELDRTLADVLAAVEAHPDNAGTQMALANFLLTQHNEQEAIPHLARVAHDEKADVPHRVWAWVALGRAHLWVVEPEKARHAAQALMAELGPRSPDAVAGGNLVRGLQDTKAKRYDRAAEELRAAVAAAPDSIYGLEAAGLLAKLPGGGK